jgi:hypothetical protein
MGLNSTLPLTALGKVGDDGTGQDAARQVHEPDSSLGQVVVRDPVSHMPDHWHTCQAAGKAAVQSSLEGVGVHDVGVQLFEAPPQLPDIPDEVCGLGHGQVPTSDLAAPHVAQAVVHGQDLDECTGLAKAFDQGPVLTEDDVGVDRLGHGRNQSQQGDLAAGQPGHVTDEHHPQPASRTEAEVSELLRLLGPQVDNGWCDLAPGLAGAQM